MYTYKAQLVGAANVIEQHLTKTPRYTAIDTTLHMDSCISQENPNHIIVCLIFSYPPYKLMKLFKRNLGPQRE